MTKQISITHSSFDAAEVAPFALDKDYSLDEYLELAKVGIGGLERIVDGGYGMDAIQADVTTPSVSTPIQFLQNWLPGFVKTITAGRKIDDLVGISTVGAWSDEEIVQGILENTGTAVPYGDLTNIPLSSYNVNFATRTVVRYEAGMKVGRLEQDRVARMQVSADNSKRESAALALEIARNLVGFYGYNSGNDNTYGFLNDPNLPAYNTVATGPVSGSKLWSLKTFAEIYTDILTGIVTIRNQSQDTINPDDVAMTLALPTSVRDYLSKTTDFGISVMDWIKQTYPKIRVTSAPQLNGANGGNNVFYLFADSVPDMSTDDGRTFIQVVPAKFQVLGVQQLVKGYEEDYVNATAGVMVKRPYAVYRGSGV